MSKNENLQKHTMNLREGDFDYIDSMFHSRSIPASLVIRTLVSNFVDSKRAEEAHAEKPQLDLPFDL